MDQGIRAVSDAYWATKGSNASLAVHEDTPLLFYDNYQDYTEVFEHNVSTPIEHGPKSARMLMLSREKEKEKARAVSTTDPRDLSTSEPASYGQRRTHIVKRRLHVAETYELEINCDGESSLSDRKKNCLKHPGHAEYIPVSAFTENHLPPVYQHPHVVKLCQCLATLTVRLLVCDVSPWRPDPPDYPPPHPRVYPMNGSGHVSDAVMYNGDDGKTCPCKECQSSDAPKTCWGKIYIHTAAHVVYDDLEADTTTCYFFYDNDDDDPEEGIKICGLEILEIDVWEDRSWIVCYTHDSALVHNLHTYAEEYEKLQKQVRELYNLDMSKVVESDRKLTVIVSHPHGCGKYISVGEYVDRIQDEDDPDWTCYTYTTPTCPGSSGAPVFILGKDGWLDYHHHSGTIKDKDEGGDKAAKKKLNKSTHGLF